MVDLCFSILLFSVCVHILLFQADEDPELNQSKSNRKSSKEKNKRKPCNKTHHDKHKDQEPNSHEHTSATRESQSWNMQPCHSLPNEESLRRVLSCPSQISLSSHVLKQHKTSFAELARYKKSLRSPSVVKNSKEDPTCSHFSQNISNGQRNTPLGQNETLITSMTGKESERSGSSETAGNIPPLGKQIKAVIQVLHFLLGEEGWHSS